MPAVFGQTKKQTELVNNLEGEFTKIARQYQLVPGDFPDPNKFKEKLALFKIEKFAKMDKKMLSLVDEVRRKCWDYLQSVCWSSGSD